MKADKWDNKLQTLVWEDQEPCDDLISRKAVDEYLTELLSGYLYDEERERLENFSAYLWELPNMKPTM